jgi:hypothetical protein
LSRAYKKRENHEDSKNTKERRENHRKILRHREFTRRETKIERGE